MEQLTFLAGDSTAIAAGAPIFGDGSYEAVFEAIRRMAGAEDESMRLKINQSGASIYMCGMVAFWVIINSRSRYLRTGASAAAGYVGRIPGVERKGEFTVIPLEIDPAHGEAVAEMVRAVYEERMSASASFGRIGCCSAFMDCSDAGRCLKAGDAYYNGCLYRANLEAGRIFYGKNKNI